MDIPIKWDVDHPDPDKLQTGDLLFPRPAAVTHLQMLEAFSHAMAFAGGNKTLRDALGPDWLEVVDAHSTPGYAALPPQKNSILMEAGGRSLFDPSDPAHLYLLLRILRATFNDLLVDWLSMTVNEFIKHPISRILIGAINKDLGDGFFVGHVAMVMREKDGEHADDGRPWVIEANITDFSRYRVSIHPYHDEATDANTGPDSARKRGWVNYRAAMGQKVWAARPLSLAAAGADQAKRTRMAIIREAKSLLGRPYGFFDHPSLGETDRLYCSEFVLSVFRAVSSAGMDLNVDDHRWWRWLLDNLPPGAFKNELEHDLQVGGLYDKVIARPFFLLTVQMLWRSARLGALLKPDGAEYA